ncbi:TetR/AcrR family transcriptional regulator [Zavarzinia sp.]|uniref:TetR/AcrR family transcriptional regulator n=1 Tax=Zavarzinia sp. TaxID=2027920 RepID=UPI0035672578
MTWDRHSRGPGDTGDSGRKGYHHGNLREALIAAAQALIVEKGLSGVTFAEAARAAGVSPAAPYRHFPDREALLAEVARRGFDVFADRLAAAWGDGRPDPSAAFTAVGRAYLAFARAEPAYYTTMFEAGLSLDDHAELRAAGDRAFGVLRAAAETLTAGLKREGRPPALMMALHIWSMSHGIASLFARADRGRRRLPMSAEDLLEAEVLIYLKGLGIAP